MRTQLEAIINLAIWAPSGDNSQPWRFVIRRNQILVFNLPDRDNPILNFRQSGSYVAHGGLIENLKIAASSYRLAPQVDLFPDPQQSDLVAVVSFVFDPQLPIDPLYSFIKSRCTNRRAYQLTSLKPADKEALLEAVLEAGSGQLLLVEDPSAKIKIGQAASVIERIALENQALHHLFFSDIIWQQKKNDTGQPGLYIKTLELPLPVQKIFKLLVSWPLTRFLNRLGFSKLAAGGNAKLYAQSSAFGLIVRPRHTPIDHILTGRLLQRIWLTATKLGLSLQPVTGLLFFHQRIQAGQTNDFAEAHVRAAANSISQLLTAFKLTAGEPMMMFRLGYAAQPTARSARMKPEIVGDEN